MINRRNAFTLVELLVVVAIIALLISILLPALGRARAQARLVVCGAQVREYTKALQYYGEDNNDTYPPHRQGGDNTDSVFNLLDGYWNGGKATRQAKTEQEKLENSALKLARCPEMNLSTDFEWNYDSDNLGYGYNAFFLGLFSWSEGLPTGMFEWEPTGNIPTKGWTKSSDVKNGAECIAFGDSAPAGMGSYNRWSITLMYVFMAKLNEGVWTRHMPVKGKVDHYVYAEKGAGYYHGHTEYPSGVAPVAFVDGHVDVMHSKDINRIIDKRRYWDPWQNVGGIMRADSEETEYKPRGR